MAVDESPRNPYSTTKTLSTQSFLNLDYAVVNCSFRILYLKYGRKGDEPDVGHFPFAFLERILTDGISSDVLFCFFIE